MKKLILGALLLTTAMIGNALPLPTASSNVNSSKDIVTLKNKQADKIFLKSVYDNVPDMQDGDKESKKKSETEGAALQFIMTGGIARTGFTVKSFSKLLNDEASIVKDYVKNQNIKGYIMITHTLFFSKGYPDIPAKDLKEFKDNAECQKGYCVLISISSVKVLDENQEEITLDKEKFTTIFEKYESKEALWEVNPANILQPYKFLTVPLLTGFGLGGLDAMDLTKDKK